MAGGAGPAQAGAVVRAASVVAESGGRALGTSTKRWTEMSRKCRLARRRFLHDKGENDGRHRCGITLKPPAWAGPPGGAARAPKARGPRRARRRTGGSCGRLASYAQRFGVRAVREPLRRVNT